MAHMGSFKPTVMFFEMTNLPAMFQAMINDIMGDMINEGKVVAFVDDILVGTETKEGYDKIVEEVLKRLEENNSYVKPEKCVQRIWKIGFLGAVIGPNGVEIEKKKVDEVLSWPEPKNMKDIKKFLDLTNLQEVYQRLCLSRKANEYIDKERCEVAVGKGAAKSI